MGMMVTNVKTEQCTIFCWNPWTTNWIRHLWSWGLLILGHGVHNKQYVQVHAECVNMEYGLLPQM